MANTATLIDKIPIVKNGNPYVVKAYKLAFDTTDTDLTVLTPSTLKRVFVVGEYGSDSTAASLTYISQSPATLPGTVSHTNGSATITGVATNFEADFLAGGPPFSIVVTDGDTLVISSVDNDLQMTATTNATQTDTGKTYKRRVTLVTPEMGSYQGIKDKVGMGFTLATWKGDSLIMRSSAAYTSYLIHLIEADVFTP